jgi:pimeloyl-ACP methyl ester carboxylesterase
VRKLTAVTAATGLAVATLVAAPLAGAANASGAASSKPAAAKSSIKWGTCADSGLQAAGAVCGYLSVPLDYSNPGGTKIQLAVSMVRHTTSAAKYQGVMLTNPGGPGGSGLTLSVLGQYVPNGAGDAYDWIGWDPRGVGSSKPALSCEPNFFQGPRLQYVPTSPSIAWQWLALSKQYAQACGKNGGALLAHLKTIDSVKDMEQIRIALGAKQINYYGFSYGTYLGQVYSTMYPAHVRRMVLDSNVDPRGVWYQANLAQDIAFERNIKIWFGWLAKYDSVYHLGKTEKAVEVLFYKEQKILYAHPAGGVVGGDEWNDIFLEAGYYQFTWTDLGAAFAGWVNNADTATLVAEYEGTDAPGDDNGFAMYDATQCTDVQWPTSWPTWREDNWATYKKAPFETWGNAWYNAACLYWPAKAGSPVTIDGSKTKSVLLIDETLDAATPYEGSLYVRSLYPNASLIAEPGGTTHAGTLFGNACVDDQIAAYLATGKLPARKPGNRADTYCAPLPQPVPTAASVSAAIASARSTSAVRSAVLTRRALTALVRG